MIIVFLIILAMLTSPVSSSRPQPLEQVMRDTLKHVMRCPKWPTDEDIQLPVAAFSPARYMQLVATVRKDSKENSCGRRSHLRFNLQDPDSWNFCAMGMCSEHQSCSCFKNFVGEKCNKFEGRCWLFYCRLVGCNSETPTLYCSCNPALYGTQTARRIYFYDHGFESSYIPPPEGFITTAFVDSQLIKQTAPEQFEIIRGNYHRANKRIRSFNMKQDKTIYGYNLPRKNINSPELQYSEQYFESDYSPNSKYIQKAHYRKYPYRESSRNPIVADDSRQLKFRNIPNSASNLFYNGKSYTSNRKNENIAENMWPENKHKLAYLSKATNEIDPSDSDDWYMRKTRNAIVPDDSRQLKFRNIPNSASNIFYNGKSYTSNRKTENIAEEMWPENEHKLAYLSKASNEIDPSDREDWYVRKTHLRDFVNGKVERGLFNDDDVYRVNRQKVLDENTITETAVDENAYDDTEDGEDFKFLSGSQTKCTFFHRTLCIIIASFILCFL